MNCPKCNHPVEQGAAFCGNCGQALLAPQAPALAPTPASSAAVPPQPVASVPAAPAMQTPSPATPGIPSYAVATPASHAGETKALLSVILGVISIPGAIVPILGILLGITGVVLGSISRGTVKRKLSLVGIIISCVGIVASIGVFTYVVAHNDKLSTKSHDPALSGTSTTAANAETPCYSVGFTNELTVKNASGSCDMSAFDGDTLEESEDAYKIYGTKSATLNAGNFQSFAKQAIDQDVASNLADFTVVSENEGTFAGSQAYIVLATQKSSGISVIEAAVLHPVSNGDNIFVLAHAIQADTADLKILEANWQWK